MKTLVWFRNDLRVDDHPALHDSCARGTVEAVFLLAPKQWRDHDVGANRLAFLLDTLHCLARDLAALNIPFHVLEAPTFRAAPAALIDLAHRIGATALACNEEYPLNERVRDSHVRRDAATAGLELRLFPGSAILPPGAVLTGSGDPYTVFSPFKRRWLATVDAGTLTPLPTPQPQPTSSATPQPAIPDTLDGASRGQGPARFWHGGSAAAGRRLQGFLRDHATDYQEARNFPARPGTSQLSPYLAIGAISARRCLQAATQANEGRLHNGLPGIDGWISELIWRDFYRHVIALFPHVSRGQAFRPEMDTVPWRNAPEDFAAWQAGRTGYPLVDAAMRQLLQTGWMHNRLRMLTAMFLTKHLLIDWRHGERHFMQQLVDGDFAANNGGWQWSASTGTDAAPYFRIFNPITQAQRFDPDGEFVRAHVEELAAVTGKAIFEPHRHEISAYPVPIVEHGFARERALATFKAARS
jgi:deoxyribodipyrimidine photo-lyase